MEPAKVQAVADWPRPRSVRVVRGFLGLARYYRKFIKDYGTIAAPLTALLRMEGFSWGEEAETVFNALKTAVMTVPVLSYPSSPSRLWWSVTCPPTASGPCSSRNNTLSRSLVGQWRHDITPWRPTNRS